MVRSKVKDSVKRHGFFSFLKKATVAVPDLIYTSVKYDINPLVLYPIYKHKFSEREFFTSILSAIKKDDVVYDIGANVGLITSLVASHPKVHHVVSFEPNRDYVQLLEERLERLNLSSRTTVFELALSDTDGTIEYHQDLHSIGTIPSTNSDSIDVPQRRGDDIIKEADIPAPDVMKIDVDGSECKVLRGFEKTLKSDDPPIIFLEVHTPITQFQHNIENFGDSISELAHILEKNNYTVSIINSKPHNYHIKATPARF